MLIVDGHLDLAWNALAWERDLLQSAHTLRTHEIAMPTQGRGQGTVALPELRSGHIGLCFATTLARSTGRAEAGIDYRSPAQACAAAQGHIAYYRALEQQGQARIIGDRPALDRHVDAWQAAIDGDRQLLVQQPLGLVISMESADPILDPEHLPLWWDMGVRIIGPTHFGPGRYAGGTGTELGLTPAGERLLAAMERQGMLLDLTHCSDQAFWQALELYHGPVLASHTNSRALVPRQRQFDDAQYRAIIERDGVIGMALDVWMLDFGWMLGRAGNPTVPLDRVVDHIDHLCQLAGSSRHIAIGSDLDGGFGREQSPADLDTIADLQRLPDLLAQRGYGADDVRGILHGNWLGLLRQAWS